MRAFLAAAVVLLCLGAGLWQYWRMSQPPVTAESGPADAGHSWLDLLYSQNPRDVEKASQEVTALGPNALPVIQATLRDPQAEAQRLKAALKAVGILGQTAAPAVEEVAGVLEEPGLTAEAAIALSHMGPDAFPPLRAGLASDDPVVRRESLRSIGKLKDRAPLDLGLVIPLLVERMKDQDASVRAVAATYLGIIHERPEASVPALIEGLSDVDPEVRRASAAALGSFTQAPDMALAALKKAAADRHDDVAREAGRSIVKLQQK